MQNSIIIYPNSREEESLYKQLARRLNNRLIIKKDKKEKILSDLSAAVEEVKLIKAGEKKPVSLKKFLSEL